MKVLMLKSWLLSLILLPFAICAEVKLPAIISDNIDTIFHEISCIIEDKVIEPDDLTHRTDKKAK